MAKSRRMTGIEPRADADGTMHYRGTATVPGRGRIRGTWTTDVQQAIAWRERAMADARAGLLVGDRVTVREATGVFVAGIADGSIRNRSGQEFKPSVVRDYRRDLARVDRLVGARKIDELRLPDAQLVVEHLRRQKGARGQRLSDSSVRNTMMALRSMYAWAMLCGLARLNPCDGLRLPIGDEVKRERIAPPREAALLTAALSGRDRTAFGLAAWAGLRAGELLALDWTHVDDDLAWLRVERSWDRSAGFVPPKSKAAYRVIPIFEPLRLILEDHSELYGRSGLLLRGRYAPERAMGHSGLLSRLYAAWDAAELERLGLHEARHTFASLLIAANSTPKTVTTYMGHSSIQITYDRYGHLFPGNEAEAKQRVNDFLRLQMED